MNRSPPIIATIPATDLPDAVRVSEGEPKPTWSPERRRRFEARKAVADKVVPPKAAAEAPALRVRAAGSCEGCGRAAAPMDIDLLRELVRLARDRLADSDGDGKTDLLYLAARLDGYCSLGCWRQHAPDGEVHRLFPRRGD